MADYENMDVEKEDEREEKAKHLEDYVSLRHANSLFTNAIKYKIPLRKDVERD